MTRALTAKQEAFCLAVAGGATLSAAYESAYNCTRQTSKSVNELASKLARDTKIASRINELRQPAIDAVRAKVRYELEDAMRECEEALGIAREKNDAKAMKGLIELKARLNGLMVEDRANRREPLTEMSDDALDAQIARDAKEAGIRVH